MVGWKKRTNFVIIDCSLFILILEVIPHHNDIEFHDIDGRITSFTYSQADNNALIHSDSNDPSSPPITLSALNDLGEISNEIFGPAEELLLAEAFPDAVLGESSLLDSPDGIFFIFLKSPSLTEL